MFLGNVITPKTGQQFEKSVKTLKKCLFLNQQAFIITVCQKVLPSRFR